MSAVLQAADPNSIFSAPESEPQDWLMCLVDLTARLEYARCELAGFHLGTDHAQIVERLELMIHVTEELSQQTEFDDAQAAQQADALVKTGTFYTTLNCVKKAPGKGLFGKVMVSLFGTSTPPPAAVRDCMTAAITALGSYFILFAARLPSLEEIAGWRDTANTFLADFKQLASDLPE